MSCIFTKKDADVIKEALKVLDKKHLALIMHGSSFPSESSEDTGFGSINSSAAKKVIEYVSNVFNVIQLGPGGKTKCSDSSPYTSTIFSNNPLLIDLKQLTTKEWDKFYPIKLIMKQSVKTRTKTKAKQRILIFAPHKRLR